jgi:hypothetical protein
MIIAEEEPPVTEVAHVEALGTGHKDVYFAKTGGMRALRERKLDDALAFARIYPAGVKPLEQGFDKVTVGPDQQIMAFGDRHPNGKAGVVTLLQEFNEHKDLIVQQHTSWKDEAGSMYFLVIPTDKSRQHELSERLKDRGLIGDNEYRELNRMLSIKRDFRDIIRRAESFEGGLGI